VVAGIKQLLKAVKPPNYEPAGNHWLIIIITCFDIDQLNNFAWLSTGTAEPAIQNNITPKENT
jgi:hypothetical protein